MKAVLKDNVTKFELALRGFYAHNLDYFIKKVNAELDIVVCFSTKEIKLLDIYDDDNGLDLSEDRYKNINVNLDDLIEWVYDND